MNRIVSLLLLAILGMAACHSDSKDHKQFGGRFLFTNKSSIELWVDIYGFKPNPPCGTLIPDGGKGSFMGMTHVPQAATITWSEGHESYMNPNAEQHTNVISLSALSNCPVDATIVFEFTSNRVWKVSCEQR